MNPRLKPFARACFAWGTWGQRIRTLFVVLFLALVVFWLYGMLSVHFYRPTTIIHLSGKTTTHCVGRYHIDLPVELGRMGLHSLTLTYGLEIDHRTVDVSIKQQDYTRADFEQAANARIKDIQEERTDWGSPTLLASELLTTPNGKVLLLRYLNSGSVLSGIDSEVHALVGNRYVVLQTKSPYPEPEPPVSKEKPMYTYMDPKPGEELLRKVALNMKGYTDAAQASEGFCAAGVVFNNKTMGYDVESGLLVSNRINQAFPGIGFTIHMAGQYGGQYEDDSLFVRMNRVIPLIREGLLTEGGHFVGLRKATPKINGMAAREYGYAMHLNKMVSFVMRTETALATGQQSLLRPFITMELEVGSLDEKVTSPLTQEQALKVWDSMLQTMRLSPANGGEQINSSTGAMTTTAKVNEACPRTGLWEATLPPDHPKAQNLAASHSRRMRVTQGEPMPKFYSFGYGQGDPEKVATDEAIVWRWIQSIQG